MNFGKNKKIVINNKYVIGCHVMFYEIEIYKEYIDGLINVLETVENKENVYIDLCLNISEKIEKIDTSKISAAQIKKKFNQGIDRLKEVGISNVVSRIVTPEDKFYLHTDYRRDINYNYCKTVDYVMWGETDSFFPKEAFFALEELSKNTKAQNIHRYTVCFADRKMWDSHWDPTVHPKYISHTFKDGPKSHLNPNQAKSQMSISDMNKVNQEIDSFVFEYINYPIVDGSCFVISSDLIKFGVNIPKCMVYNDDHAFSIMSQKLCGENYLQFVCKNLLKVHARRHPEKRLYVLGEDDIYKQIPLGKKVSSFEALRGMSDKNISTLASGSPDKFYEYADLGNEINS